VESLALLAVMPEFNNEVSSRHSVIDSQHIIGTQSHTSTVAIPQAWIDKLGRRRIDALTPGSVQDRSLISGVLPPIAISLA
jgi:hypothetical protein